MDSGPQRKYAALLHEFLPKNLCTLVSDYDPVPTRLVARITSDNREDAWYLECETMEWTKNMNCGLYSTVNSHRSFTDAHYPTVMSTLPRIVGSTLFFVDGINIQLPFALTRPWVCQPDFIMSQVFLVQGLRTRSNGRQRMVTFCVNSKTRTLVDKIEDEDMDYACMMAALGDSLATISEHRVVYGHLAMFRLSVWTRTRNWQQVRRIYLDVKPDVMFFSQRGRLVLAGKEDGMLVAQCFDIDQQHRVAVEVLRDSRCCFPYLDQDY